MNKHRVNLLTAALRGGEFTQCMTQLRDPRFTNTHCILGVACEVFRRETGQGTWEDNMFVVDGIACDITLPPQVQTWYDFDRSDPFFNNMPASELNDLYGRSFAEIADSIDIGNK